MERYGGQKNFAKFDLRRYAGTENTISKSEVAGKVSYDMLKVWRLCGLEDSDIKQIVGFLRS